MARGTHRYRTQAPHPVTRYGRVDLFVDELGDIKLDQCSAELCFRSRSSRTTRTPSPLRATKASPAGPVRSPITAGAGPSSIDWSSAASPAKLTTDAAGYHGMRAAARPSTPIWHLSGRCVRCLEPEPLSKCRRRKVGRLHDDHYRLVG